MTNRWKFKLIVSALTTSTVLLMAVVGPANAGSHPGGVATPTTATMGGHGAGGGRGPGCNYRGSGGCPSLPLGHVSGTNKQTCKPNGEGCLRPK